MNDLPPDHDVVFNPPKKGLYEIENVVVDMYIVYPFSWFDGIENES